MFLQFPEILFKIRLNYYQYYKKQTKFFFLKSNQQLIQENIIINKIYIKFLIHN